jgi:hypothetical protein
MKLYLTLILAVLLSVTSCSNYKIKDRTNPNTDLNKYKTIYIGWLDLGNERWALYNYATENEWLALLNTVNRLAVPSYFKKTFPDKIVLISKTPNDNPPEDCLYIKFTNAVLLNNADELSVDIDWVDGKSKEKLSAVTVRLKADHGLGFSGFSFENRVINSIRLLAVYIKRQMMQ